MIEPDLTIAASLKKDVFCLVVSHRDREETTCGTT